MRLRVIIFISLGCQFLAHARAPQPDCRGYLKALSLALPPSLDQLFAASEASLQASRRPHQDQIQSINEIKPGDHLWLDRKYLIDLHLPAKVPLVDSGAVQEVVVQEVYGKELRNGQHTILVHHRTLGKVAIPETRLGALFRRPDYQNRPPFEEGEWVQVGTLEDPVTDKSTGQLFHKIGKFVRMDSDGRYAVRMGPNGTGETYHFKARHVYGLPTGNADAVLTALKPFLDLEYEFEPGSFAVSRTHKTGKVITILVEKRLAGNTYEISTPNGKQHKVNGRFLSHLVGFAQPKSWTYRVKKGSEHGKEKEDLTQEPLRSFFDGARKLVSHPEFIASSEEKKLQWVARFMNRFFKERNEQSYGQTTVATAHLICSGTGTCGHKSFAVANILSEAGYPTQIGSAYSPRRSHGWVMVRMGDGIRYYLDIGKEHPITPEWLVEKRASEDPDSLDAEFYLNPAATLFEP
jgi:hypothetical protein